LTGFGRIVNPLIENWLGRAKVGFMQHAQEGDKTDNPDDTKKEYCLYDPTFKQYIYTRQWINFLVKNLKDDELYAKILKS